MCLIERLVVEFQHLDLGVTTKLSEVLQQHLVSSPVFWGFSVEEYFRRV